MRFFKQLSQVTFIVASHARGSLLLGIVIICFSGLGHAAEKPVDWSDEKTTKLNKYLEALAEQKKFNGAVLMAEDGEVVYEKYLGFADINDKSEVLGPRSSFRLASVSKQFTAMAIMMLKEQGKLGLDDDIREHLPSLPYNGITIRHLLHHNGGVPDFIGWFDEHWDTDKDYGDRNTVFNMDVIEQFSKNRPEVLFEPGEAHEYSNTGYVMLGQIIENASDMPIRQFFQDQIFTPLAMIDTQAFSPGKDFTVVERVYGFELLADGLTQEDHDWDFLNGVIGDGGIYSSARDMLKWDQAWYSEKLVSLETIAEAYVSGKTNDGEETGYGFGWGLLKNKEGEVTTVAHSGSWVGFETMIQRNLKDNRTGIVLTNDSGEGIGRIIQGLGQLYLGEELIPPLKNMNYELAAIIETEGVDAAIARFNEIESTENEDYFVIDALVERLANFYRDTGRDEVGDKLEELVNRHPDIVLTHEQFDVFVGKYALTEDFQIEIFRRGSQLLGQATGQGEFQMIPIVYSRFKVVDEYAEISFTRNEEGEAESLTLHQNGENQIATKIRE